jgi:hypothetical protein
MTTIVTELLFFVSLTVHADVHCGQVSALQGQVEIIKMKADDHDGKVGNAFPAALQSQVCGSDILITRAASRALIRFDEDTALTVGPQSRIVIGEALKNATKPSWIQMTYGKVRMLFHHAIRESNPDDLRSQFQLTTPSAVVGVRGTDFFVSYDLGTHVTEQATVSGVVAVQRKGDKHSVLVKTGEQVRVHAILSPVTKIEPQVRDAVRQVSTVAKNDPQFVSKEATEVLGPPEVWKVPPEEVPMDLQHIKNEF